MSHLSEEQRLMRESCRAFVDDVVIPFIRGNWQREWDMRPQARLPPEILAGADKVGIRTLAVPEEFGGMELDKVNEVQTFALIAEEIARGDSGLADKLVQNWKVSVLLRNLSADGGEIRRAGTITTAPPVWLPGVVSARRPATPPRAAEPDLPIVQARSILPPDRANQRVAAFS